jgi:predicted DNA-binding transcriptional regulator YafY
MSASGRNPVPQGKRAAASPVVPRLIGSGRLPGMVQLHQALPLVERQHALIEELRASAPRFVTGAQLAARTGTTVRTVERDIARLGAAGVPVQVRRGPGGGYRLDVPGRLPPVTLTPGEAAALIAALVAIGPYISAAAQTALQKLLSVLAPVSLR